MKILYLHQYFSTPAMAAGTRSYEMARRLVAAGNEVDMITSDQAPTRVGRGWRVSDEAGIRVHWTPVPYGNEMSSAGRIRAFLDFAVRASRRAAKVGGDVVFATSTPLTVAIPAVRASTRLGVPMVFEVRDLWPAVPIAIGAIRGAPAIWATRRLERYAYDHAAHVVALAPGMREHICALGYPRDKVSVIPNGADLDVFADPRHQLRASELRAAMPWLGKRRLVLYAGTFGLVNGVDYLARLAAKVAVLDPEVRFVAIGRGRFLEAVKETAAALGVRDRNLFFFDSMPKHEVAAWLAAADMSLALFTGPEIVWRDAVQNKFFDALAAGKPVANNFRGWQAIVAEEAGAGLVLDPVDLDGAARKLVNHLGDAEWMSSAAATASQLGKTRFNRDKLANQLLDRLNAVVEHAK
jgi:glycosyltransferase involved in cell wall biosynthesis